MGEGMAEADAERTALAALGDARGGEPAIPACAADEERSAGAAREREGNKRGLLTRLAALVYCRDDHRDGRCWCWSIDYRLVIPGTISAPSASCRGRYSDGRCADVSAALYSRPRSDLSSAEVGCIGGNDPLVNKCPPHVLAVHCVRGIFTLDRVDTFGHTPQDTAGGLAEAFVSVTAQAVEPRLTA